MKIVGPEDRAVAEFDRRREAKEKGFDELTVVSGKPEPEYKSEVPGVSDEEFSAGLQQHLENQIAEGWEIVREEAEETLRVNPDDETAKLHLMQYANWKSRQQLPPARRGGNVIFTKTKVRLSDKKIGVWTKTKIGWALKVSPRGKCSVGDIVEVKRKGGFTERMRLTEKLDEIFFRGVKIN